MRVFLFSILFVLLFSIFVSTSYAETWKISIPAGAANPEGPAHFLPIEISIRPGNKVHWGNADTVDHTVTSGTLATGITPRFDSGHMEPGSGFTVFFDEQDVGEIKYFCTIHPWMNGIVNVMELAEGFQVFHNIGSEFTDSPVDMPYKVTRNLVDVLVDHARNRVLLR